jgi:acyl phosphate:glycerol-3-phosphate acyltransferase
MRPETFFILAIFGFSFLFGSIPFGYLISRFFNKGDLRKQGSGNTGATNVTRVLGFWPAGALTFLLDALKGTFSVFLVSSPLGLRVAEWFFDLSGFSSPLWVVWTTGFFAVLGHCYSPWLFCKGGKGVATGFGVLLFLSPCAALVGLVAFAFTFLQNRMGSLASLMGLWATVVTHCALYPINHHLFAGLALVLLILFRHESNIDALLAGTEKTL